MKVALPFTCLLLIASTSAMAKSNNYAEFLAKNINTSNKSWSWSALQKMPNIKLKGKAPEMTADLTKNRHVRVSGTSATPNVVTFESYIQPEGNEKLLWKLSDFVNPNELSKVQTSCSSDKDEYGNESSYYQLNKKGTGSMFVGYDHQTSGQGHMAVNIQFSPSLKNLCP